MKKYWLIAIVGSLALLAAACQSAPQPAVQIAPLDVLQPAEAPGLLGEAEPQVSGSEPAAQTEPESAAPVVVRQGLAATNPATVNLSNGSPTLVEFFAFW